MNKGIAAAIAAPFFIALSIITTKLAGQVAPPLVIAGLSSLIAVPFLLIIALILKSDLQINKLLGELRVPFLKVLFTRAIFGQALIITGFTMTAAIKAVLLLRLEPIFVFLWSMLYNKEKAKPKKIILLIILLIGSSLVVAPNQSMAGPNLGDACIIASLLFLSYSYMPTQEIVERSSPQGLNILTNVLGGLVITAFAFLVPHQAIPLSVKAFVLITSYSFVFFVVGASLYFYAFKTLKPWVIASFLSLEVVFGVLQAYIILRESMTIVQILGAIIVLTVTGLMARYSHSESDLKEKV